MKNRSFIDTIVLKVKAGKGGNGCASFRREKYIPKGGPDGGDGGNGGSIYLRGTFNEDNLVKLFHNPEQKAETGGYGSGQQKHGKNGADLYLNVPVGTEVKDELTGRFLGDITSDGETLLVAKGGKGGLGNVHWKTSTNRAPRQQTNGEDGMELLLRLDLKLVADVGLVGYPNAGKSSLVTAISHAHPKIAAYPFTTLNPIIGTMELEDFTKIKVADIPGLIEGAHNGIGLGHSFLRHIERSAFLVFIIDMAGIDGRKPWDDYKSLRNELKLYKEELADRASIVVANKMDVETAKDNLKKFKTKTKTKPIEISALTGLGLDKLKKAIYKAVRKNSGQ